MKNYQKQSKNHPKASTNNKNRQKPSKTVKNNKKRSTPIKNRQKYVEIDQKLSVIRRELSKNVKNTPKKCLKYVKYL